MLALIPLSRLAPGFRGSDPGSALADLDKRREAVLAEHVRSPFPSPECTVGKPDDGACVWAQITLAHAILALPAERARAAEAWRLLRGAVAGAGAGMAARREGVSVDFAFLTSVLLFGVASRFGASAEADLRLPEDLLASINGLFRTWAADECPVEQARLEYASRPRGSENLDLQRVHACWAAAELLSRDPGSRDAIYRDGSDPDTQRAAWTAYLAHYLRTKATSGAVIEYFSPVYSKYMLNVLCSLHDFASDGALRGLAGDLLTLWWALWAQEQVAGVHGGSKARFYPPKGRNGAAPVPGVVWVYFRLGALGRDASNPGDFPLLTTRYRVPAVVADIAAAAAGGRAHEVWTRQSGLAASPPAHGRYHVSPDLAITRYSFVARDFAMGAAMVPRLPAARWAAISSQNRFNGVALADGPDAVVYAAPAAQGGRSTYNAVLAGQSRGAQIVQRLPPPFSRGAGEMAIHVGPRLRRVERDGWIFVEGSAFVAARPAFGGYAADADRSSYRLHDQRSPVVIQAGTRADHAGFEAFQAAVLAAPLRADGQEVSFGGLDGAGDLRFFLDSDRRPEVDGKPIEAPAGWVLHSPFVRQAMGSGTVEIGEGARTLRLSFD